MRVATSVLIALIALCCDTARGADDAVTVAEAKVDANGFRVHDVRSPYQAGVTTIRVLLPDKVEKDRAYPVVYLLPVEARDESRFGDGLLEAKRANLANRHRAVFVAPAFSHLPWYADHPSDPAIRQESYFLKVVLPFVEKRYPVRREAAGRLLVGFSKSGWGAFSLLLRNPDAFGKAVAWDAPLMMDKPGKYGSGDVFGTAENFEKYRVSALLAARAADAKLAGRLFHFGYGNFRDEHRRAEALLATLRIDHGYRDGPQRTHEWGSGWLPEAVAMVLPAEPERGK